MAAFAASKRANMGLEMAGRTLYVYSMACDMPPEAFHGCCSSRPVSLKKLMDITAHGQVTSVWNLVCVPHRLQPVSLLCALAYVLGRGS